MLAPLWFATFVGPYFTGPSMFVGDGGWLGGLALAAAIISVPLQYWIRHLANNWPSSYDACLRARVPEDEEGEGTSASLEVATKSAKPPGSTILRLAAVLAPLIISSWIRAGHRVLRRRRRGRRVPEGAD